MTYRSSIATTLLAALAALALGHAATAADTPATRPARPNILWLTAEDMGPHLGCYGDAYASTPHLDRLAGRSLRYLNCWSTAPVYAPARTAIITGVYPSATGSEHMRSVVRMPPGMRMYPQVLRDAGYYCTNNVKEDYNLVKPGKVWDESSNGAHYRGRPAGQPFFAVFNFNGTHESQVRRRPHVAVHDPAKVPLPAYHPDAPEVRQDWAQYHDNITTMDAWAGQKLKELADAGLAENTIVFFYGDHGPGLPGGKRSCRNSGLLVPLVVHVPAKWQHLAPPEYAAGGATDRLVSFVDLAPTLLGLAGAEVPKWVQGEAFAGPAAGKPREYVYGLRGRMDERHDLVRAVRDKRYVYVRNYLPHRPAGQHVAYMFQTPTTRVWKDLFDRGRLTPERSAFWRPKPAEELYDLQSDRDEVRNLAGLAEHEATLKRLRGALREWVLQTRDVGLLPEGDMHERAKGSTPYEVGRDDAKYPLARVLETAELASAGLTPDGPVGAVPVELAVRLTDADPAVRYWAATGLLARGRPAVTAAAGSLRKAMADDSSPYVRVVAAEALGKHGTDADLAAALDALVGLADVRKAGGYVAVPALTAIDELGSRAAGAKDRIAGLPRTDPGAPPTMREYVPRLTERIGEALGIPQFVPRP